MKWAFLSFAVLYYLPSSGLCAEWPSVRLNSMEEILYDGGVAVGLEGIGRQFVELLRDCAPGPNNLSASAEWIRLAFHDAATHGVEGEGLGGLDASIRFELDRPENVGAGMTSALLDFSNMNDKYLSRADIIAAGLVHAVVTCGGPIVPFRGGRIDAIQAGPAGVPEPQQELSSHVAAFSRMGFSQEEMIGLVACGHTVGGVRNPDFPGLVPPAKPSGNSPFPVNNVHSFDSTAAFDNAVVREYLNGTSRNPLVVHENTTMLSDLRIFNSDNNKTMQRLADTKTFERTCSNLLERMINTVPKTVELTDVIRPIPVKVGPTFLTFNTSLGLRTDLRLLTANPDRKVTLRWRDRTENKEVYSALPSQVIETPTPLGRRLGISPVHYHFAPEINSTASISKFWFEVDEGRGETIRYDNEGEGYPILQDTLVFALQLSTRGPGQNLVVAIKDSPSISDVKATIFNPEEHDPTTTTVTFSPDASRPGVSGYTFYNSSVSTSLFRYSFDISASVDGKVFTEEYLQSMYIVYRAF